MQAKCYYRISWETNRSIGCPMTVEVTTAEAMCLLVAYLSRPDVDQVTKITIEPFAPMNP